MFPASVTAAAQAHGVAEYPREAAGLVVDGAYLPCANLSPNPEKTFEIDGDLFLKYRGRIEALIHSHPDWWPVPSEKDMRQQLAMDVPWGIYNVAKATGKTSADPVTFSPVVWFGRQVPKGPLIGRGFMHGFTDCLSEIEDYHALQGIKLPPSPRSWEWWLDSIDDDGTPVPAKDFYRDLYEPYGFERIDGPAPGAVFMVAMGELPDGRSITTPNHAGIYLGNHRILHHLTRRNPIDFTRKSARQSLSHWTPFFNAPPIWVRHRDLKTKGLIEIT